MIVGENWDFLWTNLELKVFLEYWVSGMEIPEIAHALNRKVPEVEILILDLREKKRLPAPGSSEIVHASNAGRPRAKINCDNLHQLYMSDMTLKEIAEKFFVSEKTLSTILADLRSKDPEKWPLRESQKGNSLPRADATKKRRRLPRQRGNVDLEEMRRLYTDSSVPMDDIAAHFAMSRKTLDALIKQQRASNPASWPKRITTCGGRKKKNA